MSEPVQPTETPVAIPVAAQTQAPGPIQYVVMQKSLEGVGGWLIFWVVVFSLIGIGSIYSFFAAFSNLGTATGIAAVIFSSLMAIGYTASVITIALRKKLSKTIVYATLAIGTLSSITNTIIGATTTSNQSVATTIAAVLVSVVLFGLIALYFLVSKRVKVTLTR